MKVKATEVGYYDGVLRYTGDVFDVPDGESALWFEPFETSEAPQAPPDNDPLGIQALDTPPEEPQPGPLEEAQPEEPQPETDNKPRKTNKPA